MLHIIINFHAYYKIYFKIYNLFIKFIIIVTDTFQYDGYPINATQIF